MPTKRPRANPPIYSAEVHFKNGSGMTVNFDDDSKLRTFTSACEAYIKDPSKTKYIICQAAFSNNIDNGVGVLLTEVIAVLRTINRKP